MANTTLRAYLNDLKALLEREALEEVIGHCRHIIQHFPKNIEAYRTLGSALLERGRRAEAADVFQRVLGAVPDDFTAHIGLGSAYEESNVGAAVWHLERALEQEPTHQALQEEMSRLLTVRDGSAPAGFNLTRGALARVYLKSQLYNQAIVELQGALQQNKERVDLAVLLARTLWVSSHPVEASEVALQILRNYPDNVEANRIMAALWLAMGRPSDAEPFVARLEQLDPFLAWETLHPEGAPVPRDAFQLPRLQWDARTAASMDSSLPDWVSTIGDVFEAQEQAAGALGASGVGPIVSPWADDDVAGLGADLPPAESGDLIPDWLNDVVETPPEPPISEASSTVANAFADYAPDWLADEGTPGAPDAFAEMTSAQTVEDALDWLQAGQMPGAPPAQGDDFAGYQPQTEAAEPDELPPDFTEDAFSWLNTAPLPAEDASAPAAQRGRMPGETGPLSMLEPPAGMAGATRPPKAPAESELDADALAWLQTGSLPAPDSELPPTLDFSAFEADLETEGGASNWLQAGDLAAEGESLETSAEFLGDIEDTDSVWPSGPDTAESAMLASGESAPDLAFDSAWLPDLSAPAQAAPPDSYAPIEAAEPEISLDFAELAADAGEPGDMAALESGDWLSGLSATLGEGPGDQAPDLDLDAWAARAEELPLDLGGAAESLPGLAPAADIPSWISELRQNELAGTDAGEFESELPPAEEPISSLGAGEETGLALGEEISLESLDLPWMKREAPRPEESRDAGLGPLGDLFLNDEPELTGSGGETAAPEDAALEAEKEDMMAWMRQVGILHEQQEAAASELPIDEDLLASVAPEDMAETPAPGAIPAEGSVTEAEVLAFLRNPAAYEADDLFAQMNQAEAAEAGEQTPLPAPPAQSVPAFSAPLSDVKETVLEDDFLAAFEVEVSSAPHGDVDDAADWLNTLGGAPAEPLADDWLAQMSTRAPVTAMEEPAPVELPDENASGAPTEPVEDIPLWQRPAVTASLAQAAAAMEMFHPEEPLVSEDDIPAWMREAADELLVAPTDSTPIAAEDDSSSRGLLGYMPQTDAPSRTRMDTGVLEPDRAPEWLAALSTEEDVLPEVEAAVSDVQLDWLAAPGEGDEAVGVAESNVPPLAEALEPDAAFEVEPGETDLNMDWLDNVVAAETKGSGAAPVFDADFSETAAEAFESVEPGLNFEPGFEQPVAGDIPAWMQELGLTPPAEASDAASLPPSQAAPTPLEELDFSSLEVGAPPEEWVAKATDLADTTNDADFAAPAPEPEPPALPASPAAPPAESGTVTRFSFKKEPAWKRKRPGSDGAP